MKNQKKQKCSMRKLLVWTLLLLLLVNFVTAIGIRPAKTTILSEEVSNYQGTFWVVNNDGLEFSAKIYLEGEMSKYITLDTEELSFRNDDDSLPINFQVNLPSSVPPGGSSAKIIVEQNIAGSFDNTISSKIVLKHKIIVQGPYPDKYVKTKLNFHESNNRIEFVSEVENLGKLDIEKLKTIFYVNDKQQNQQVLETEETSLAKSENKLLKTTLEKGLFDLGEFEVSAITEYDDQRVELIKNLIVGEPKVDVTYFDNFMIANKINQYTLDLLNTWNKKIKNVFVDVKVTKDSKQIDKFRTKSVDLEAELSERINDYYDAREVNPGAYEFELIVNFWNLVRMDQESFKFETEFLSEGEFEEVENLVGLASSTSLEKKSLSTSWILLIVIMGLIILVLASIMLYRYFHRDQYEGGDEGF